MYSTHFNPRLPRVNSQHVGQVGRGFFSDIGGGIGNVFGGLGGGIGSVARGMFGGSKGSLGGLSGRRKIIGIY